MINESRFRKFVLGILAITGAIYIYYIFLFSATPNNLPSVSDDISYLSGAEVFSELNSVKARTLVNETASRILECDWYGPVYPVFYGTLFKLFGNNPKLLVYCNISALLLIIALVFYYFRNNNLKEILAVTILLSPATVLFTFRFVPTLVNALQGFILILLLHSYAFEMDEKKKTKLLIVFLICVVAFSFFRNYFVFYAIALIPLQKNIRNAILASVAFAGSFLITFFFLKYFTAITAPTFKAMDNISLSGTLSTLMIQFGNNIQKYVQIIKALFTLQGDYYNLHLFLLLFLPPVTLTLGLVKKDRFIIGVSSFLLINLMVFALVYSFSDDFFKRHSVHLIVPTMLTLFLSIDSLKFRVATLLLLSLPFLSLIRTRDIPANIAYGNKVYRLVHNDPVYDHLQKIKTNINDNKDQVVNVLLDRNFLKENKLIILYSIPRISESGQMIRYTINPYPDTPPDTLWGKIPISYFLIPEKITFFDEHLVFAGPGFKFCKNPQFSYN